MKKKETFWVGVGLKRGQGSSGTTFVKEVSSSEAKVKPRFFDKECALIYLNKLWNYNGGDSIKIITIRGPYEKGRVISKGSVKDYFDKDNFKYTSERFKASHKDWVGMAHVIQDSKGNEAAMFFSEAQKATSPMSPKKAIPKPKILSLASVKEI